MKTWRPELLKHVAAHSILIAAFIVASVPTVQAEALFLLRKTVPAVTGQDNSSRTTPRSLLTLDEKGDLLIQYRSARFTVAYNQPVDQFKPSEQHMNPQREQPNAINGISIMASLTF